MIQNNNQRRILLIYPNAGQDVLGINVGLPLALVYIGTALKNAGYGVTILDQRVQKTFDSLLAKEIAAGPVYVGISSMTGYQINYGLHIAHRIRQLNSDIPIVWGGVHPTIHPEATIRHPLVDYVVINEGEETAVELADALVSHGDLHSVRGIAFKEGDQAVINPERPQMDLDNLPRLDYSLLDLEDYFTLGHISRLNQLQMVTSRGCPFRCDYCYLTMPQLRGYRWWSAERVYNEVKYLSETYGVKSIFFYDDYFFGNRRRVEELIGMLEEKPLGVQFEVSCRIDFLARESDEFLARMARAGFTELLIGVESGSDRILKLIKKDFNCEQIIRANRKMAKAGITSKLSWLAGFPTETAEDFFQTVDLMLQMQNENPLCSLTPLGIYTPYPGTELYERCKDEYGMKFPETLEGWAEYQWQKNNNFFLNARELRLLTKLSVASRYFDVKLFERFGQKRFRSILMLVYYLYGSLIRFRVRKRFFGLMPEVTLLNMLQDYYINSTHKKFLASRESRLAIAASPPSA
ncbi:MAG: radical SAM protein [Acidobacteriia bacterium]|nr:radical SAM protein [Terriglobia bacterium]